MRNLPELNTLTTHLDLRIGAAEIQNRSIAMPDKMALIAFDEFDAATLVRPTITVVRQPIAQLGRKATSALLARISGKLHSEPGQCITSSTELVIRGVPITEVDYQHKSKPHTLTLIGFNNEVRGDSSLLDIERMVLYGLIALLVLVLLVGAVVYMLR